MKLTDAERQKIREHLLEGNSPGDLADLYIDSLDTYELYELTKEIKQWERITTNRSSQ